jgi:hypothetical protein
MILDKKQMSEEDIKLQYITPAITSKWQIQKITMETQLTDGKINLRGNLVARNKAKFADQCKFPKEEEEVLRPDELLKQYHEKRVALDAKIDATLNEIQQMLGIEIK